MNTSRKLAIRCSLLVPLTWTASTLAQEEEPQQQQEQPQQQQQQSDIPVTEREYSQPEERPEPPGKATGMEVPETAEVAQYAGVGSPLSYARATVVELGGTFAFTHQSQTTQFRISPSIGYFFIDNVQLTLFGDLTIFDVSGETDVQLGLIGEPSYHLPLSDELFVFGGLGVGFTYSDEPGFDFALRPRLGMDIMVGRSGIFKPAAFAEVGVGDGLYAGGVEAGFTVMW